MIRIVGESVYAAVNPKNQMDLLNQCLISYKKLCFDKGWSEDKKPKAFEEPPVKFKIKHVCIFF